MRKAMELKQQAEEFEVFKRQQTNALMEEKERLAREREELI